MGQTHQTTLCSPPGQRYLARVLNVLESELNSHGWRNEGVSTTNSFVTIEEGIPANLVAEGAALDPYHSGMSYAMG